MQVKKNAAKGKKKEQTHIGIKVRAGIEYKKRGERKSEREMQDEGKETGKVKLEEEKKGIKGES